MKREEATKIAETALTELTEALAEGKSETLLKYLDMVAKFHHYSFGNCMMIARQNPDATYVAGFRRWQQLGRQVKQGEKGIAILAPLVSRKKDDAKGDEGEKTVFGFRAVHVFDISQTDGEELPQLAGVGGDAGDNLARLEMLVAKHNIELEYAPLDGATDGLSTSGKIIVDDSLPLAERFAVLAHELAHELLHKGARRTETTKTVRETEAEAVAYVVCRAVELDTASRSTDYIQLYRGDSETLQESLDFIQRVSASIIADLQSSDVSEQSLDEPQQAVA